MDILIAILAMMGLVLIPWGAVAGTKLLLATQGRQLPPDDPRDREDLPQLRRLMSSDCQSVVTRSYRNRLSGLYVARVSCPDLKQHNWVHAKNEKELREAIEKVFEYHEKLCRLL